MNKREIKVSVVMLIFFAIIIVIAFFAKNDSTKIKLSNIKVKNKDIVMLSETELKICIKGLIKYLNDEYYYECDKITFFNNTYDPDNNDKYFYALVDGADKSLIEIKNLGNSKFKYTYIGNELTEDAKSKETGVTYLQIVDPEDYEIGKKLEKEMEENKKNNVITDAVPVE